MRVENAALPCLSRRTTTAQSIIRKGQPLTDETSAAERNVADRLSAVFVTQAQAASEGLTAIPIVCVAGPDALDALDLSPAERAWIAANGFKATHMSTLALPGADGAITRILFGLGAAETSGAIGPREHAAGRLASLLPKGTYRFEAVDGLDREVVSLAWGLGAYRFQRKGDQGTATQTGTASLDTRSGTEANGGPRLILSDDVDQTRVREMAAAIWAGRDLINMPANELGPADLAGAVEDLATRFDAEFTVWPGDAPTFKDTFPLVDAVGRASTRPPYVADLTWGRPDALSITLVGKGIVFDTGGLDIKPASGMRHMKKDMGGAAAAITAARMIMALGLNVRLRLVITAAENAIAGNAFRPGDIVPSRKGLTVEIGNTDAEGRLVLADGLALADETPSDVLITFATLTGAARVALGTDVPAMFATDDRIAATLHAAGLKHGDPVWRLPFWPGYDRQVDGTISDLRNVGDGPFGGAIFAALFLKRFVSNASSYTHFDMYAWRQASHPLGPAGGDPQCARAVLAMVETLLSERAT